MLPRGENSLRKESTMAYQMVFHLAVGSLLTFTRVPAEVAKPEIRRPPEGAVGIWKVSETQAKVEWKCAE